MPDDNKIAKKEPFDFWPEPAVIARNEFNYKSLVLELQHFGGLQSWLPVLLRAFHLSQQAGAEVDRIRPR